MTKNIIDRIRNTINMFFKDEIKHNKFVGTRKKLTILIIFYRHTNDI